MGIDVAVAQLLCCAKSIGVDFSDTLMIGRQSINDHSSAFTEYFAIIGIPKESFSGIRKGEFAEPLMKLLGANRICSLDASNYQQATHICDLNQPCPAQLFRKFSLVLDAGTLEHVFNLPQAFKNCMEMVCVGGHFVQVTAGNNFMGHGFWQISPEAIYRIFSRQNGFRVKAVFLREVVPGGAWYRVVDPVRYGGRAQLVNDEPTYICTIAQRTTDEEAFTAWPQQSDYVQTWRHRDATDERRVESRSRSLSQIIPQPIKRLLRGGIRAARLLSPFDSPYFSYVSANDFVRGRLGAP